MRNLLFLTLLAFVACSNAQPAQKPVEQEASVVEIQTGD